jgi:predicted membrane-bound spermidine synthase
MKPDDFLNAARVPASIQPQKFGPWEIERVPLPLLPEKFGGSSRQPHMTVLRHEITMDYSNMHKANDEGRVMDVVMEDSAPELRRHLPIWMQAHGRVLITGLGLGCVVRGLLTSPRVEHIDVVEIDLDILRIVGAEFAGNPRVTLHHGDAMQVEFPKDTKWHFAWHDLWTDGDRHLQSLHAELMVRFRDRVVHQQGAWAFPKAMKKYWSRFYPLLGAPKVRAA